MFTVLLLALVLVCIVLNDWLAVEENETRKLMSNDDIG